MIDPELLPTAVLGARFSEAVRWAAMLHADDIRKGTRIAYVSHLLGVASLVLEDGGTEAEAIAALLHDAIEDRGTPEAENRARFGQAHRRHRGRVLTSRATSTATAATWRERKTRYLEHLEAGVSEVGAAGDAADKLHNGPLDPRRLARSRAPACGTSSTRRSTITSRYYTELVRVLSDAHDGPHRA
jgi:GTP pyrophosphokinase